MTCFKENYKNLIFYLLLILACFQIHANQNEKGLPFVKNYTPELYDSQGQNWAIAQDGNGFMYFGNTDGCVLQYDGVSWRQIPVTNGTIVRSLAVDENNTIYVGAQNEIGYLETDSTGLYRYVSLLPEIDSKYKDFGNVWQIFKTPDYLYFCTRQYLFRRDSAGNYKIWEANTTFHTLFYIKDKGIFVHQMDIGLMMFAGDSLKLIPQGEKFKSDWVYVVLPYDNDKYLVGSRKSGLFLFNGKSIEKFQNSANDWLIENHLYHGIKLKDGKFALGTLRNGIIILNEFGDIVDIIDKNSGLLDENVWYVYQDNSGAIWLALNHGICRIEYPSPFTVYDERNNLEGNVQDITRHKNLLYAATGLGVYVLEKSEDGLSHSKFRLVPGLKSQCWALLPLDETLLVSCNHGIFEYKNNDFYQITPKSAWQMSRSSKDPNRIFLGLDKGVSSIYKSSTGWKDEERIPGIKAEARTIVQDESGNLWVGTTYEGVYHININDRKKPVIQHYDIKNGLPTNKYNLAFSNGTDVFFGTTDGIYNFNSGLQQFQPIKIENDFEHYFSDTTSYTILHIDDNENIWFNHLEKPALAEKKMNAYHINCSSFLSIPDASIFTFYSEKNGITWIGGAMGILRYDSNILTNAQRPISTYIRRVTVNNSKIIFGGDINQEFKEFSLSPVSNAFRFEYASPDYGEESANLYQYRLNGLEKNWSEWNAETRRDFTNLSAGHYNFQVRSKNIFEQVSPAADFNFTILPPWYKTWWAYFGFTILLGIWIFVSIRWLIHRTQQKAIAERIRVENIEKQAEEKMRSKVAADFHDELGNRITKISLFSEILRSNISKSSEKTVDYLNKINENANNLYNETRDFIWHLDPSKDTLRDLAIRLNTFGDELFEGTNTNFEFKTYGDNIKQIRLKMDWRQHILRIFKEAMHNALKYSGSTTVILKITSKENRAIIELSDNGKGFDVSKGSTGVGLKNMKNRAEAIQSKLMIQSEPGKGASIRLEIDLP